MSHTVVIAGGGTAGHVFPAIAVAQELCRLDPELEPVFVGVDDRLEATLVPEAGFRLHHIEAAAIPRRLSPRLVTVPFALRRSVRCCAEILRDERARVVVTFGGYVSFPVARAAWREQLPLIVHEQNAVPGLANRVAARWADTVAVTFPGSADRFRHPERTAVTGDPVREDVRDLDPRRARADARRRLGLDPDRPTLLVFGGSQGARRINEAIVDAHGRWEITDLQVLHAAGRAAYDDTARAWAAAREERMGPAVQVVPFIDDMAEAYAAADLVVCRAGATSIAELTVLGLPAVLVPYPHATADHQAANAAALATIGGARVVADADLDGAALVAAVQPLLRDPQALATMSRAARAFGRPDAAANLARLVLSHLGDCS